MMKNIWLKITMMDPVMWRCVKNPFKWSQIIYYFCVNPELIKKVKLDVDKELARWYEQRDW